MMASKTRKPKRGWRKTFACHFEFFLYDKLTAGSFVPGCILMFNNNSNKNNINDLIAVIMWFLLCIVYVFKNSSMLFSFTRRLLLMLLVRGELVNFSHNIQNVENVWFERSWKCHGSSDISYLRRISFLQWPHVVNIMRLPWWCYQTLIDMWKLSLITFLVVAFHQSKLRFGMDTPKIQHKVVGIFWHMSITT